jgi:hypothetical protein
MVSVPSEMSGLKRHGRSLEIIKFGFSGGSWKIAEGSRQSCLETHVEIFKKARRADSE